MKGANRKTRLDQRQVRITAAAGNQMTMVIRKKRSKKRLECEAKELTSQLKKAERTEAQARDKTRLNGTVNG